MKSVLLIIPRLHTNLSGIIHLLKDHGYEITVVAENSYCDPIFKTQVNIINRGSTLGNILQIAKILCNSNIIIWRIFSRKLWLIDLISILILNQRKKVVFYNQKQIEPFFKKRKKRYFFARKVELYCMKWIFRYFWLPVQVSGSLPSSFPKQKMCLSGFMPSLHFFQPENINSRVIKFSIIGKFQKRKRNVQALNLCIKIGREFIRRGAVHNVNICLIAHKYDSQTEFETREFVANKNEKNKNIEIEIKSDLTHYQVQQELLASHIFCLISKNETGAVSPEEAAINGCLVILDNEVNTNSELKKSRFVKLHKFKNDITNEDCELIFEWLSRFNFGVALKREISKDYSLNVSAQKIEFLKMINDIDPIK